MKNLIRSEFHKLKLSFIIAILICTLYEIISEIIIANTTAIAYPIALWKNELFLFLLPLISVLPFCWQIYYEKKNGYLKSVHVRIQLRKYLLKKYFVTIVLSGFAVFIINMLGLLTSLYAIPFQYSEQGTTYRILFMADYQINHPLVYGTILSLWRGLISCLFCTMGFILALKGRNLFVALTGPFVYYIVENYITASLRVPSISLTTSIDPNRLQGKAISFSKLLIGPAILCIIILFIWHGIRFKEKSNV